jgi:hypothetical protein
MKPWYALGAKTLLTQREKGLMPADPVEVSLVGGKGLVVRQDMPVARLDWRMLVNLDVWVVAGKLCALDWVLSVVDGVARNRPKSLYLRFDQHDIEVGTGLHLPAVGELPAVHEFEWTPINCSGTKWGARLRDALISTHPRWTLL